MPEYRVTFGQRYHREPHPTFPAAHPDGWLAIDATDEDTAREVAHLMLGTHWAFLYDAATSDVDWALYFPLGELDRVVT